MFGFRPSPDLLGWKVVVRIYQFADSNLPSGESRRSTRYPKAIKQLSTSSQRSLLDHFRPIRTERGPRVDRIGAGRVTSFEHLYGECLGMVARVDRGSRLISGCRIYPSAVDGPYGRIPAGHLRGGNGVLRRCVVDDVFVETGFDCFDSSFPHSDSLGPHATANRRRSSCYDGGIT